MRRLGTGLIRRLSQFEPQAVEVRGGMGYVPALLEDEAYTFAPAQRDAMVEVPATAENLELLNKFVLSVILKKAAEHGRM